MPNETLPKADVFLVPRNPSLYTHQTIQPYRTMNRLNLSKALAAAFLASQITSGSVGKAETVTTSVTSSGMKVETTVSNTWTPNSKAIIDRASKGAWQFIEQKSGQSTVFRIYRGDFVLGSFDGHSNFEIVFQLPSALKKGQTYRLNTVPKSRPATISGEYGPLAEMGDGEITASRFVNPSAGWMREADEASVEIISLTGTEVVIQLKLRAKLVPEMNFEMNERFTMEISNPDRAALDF